MTGRPADYIRFSTVRMLIRARMASTWLSTITHLIPKLQGTAVPNCKSIRCPSPSTLHGGTVEWDLLSLFLCSQYADGAFFDCNGVTRIRLLLAPSAPYLPCRHRSEHGASLCHSPNLSSSLLASAEMADRKGPGCNGYHLSVENGVLPHWESHDTVQRCSSLYRTTSSPGCQAPT